jgi:Domain of unknown function (DUF1963)
MTHLAQIAINEVPMPESASEWREEALVLPGHRGDVVRIFADLYDSSIGVGRAVVLVCSEADLDHAPTSVPVGGETSDDPPVEIPEQTVELTPIVTVPEVWPGVRDSMWDRAPGPAADYQRWYDTVVARLEPQHVLGGHPRSLQDDVRDGAALNVQKFYKDADGLAAPAAWTSLLHLHDDAPSGTRAGSELNVLIPSRDLASMRHDRLVCVPESS